MATVFIQKKKRKNRNSYVIMYKNPLTGKVKYYKTLQKQKEAQKVANDLRTLLDTGKVPSSNKAKQKVMAITFREIGSLLDLAWKQKVINSELSPKTYEDYSLRLNQLYNTFGKKLLCEINPNQVLDYRNDLAEKISNATSNRYLFIIKQVFKQSMGEGATIEDPAESIGYLSEKDHERNRYVLPDAIDTLIEASQQTRAKFYMPALILLGAEHGASRQEVLSLEWGDIDFDLQGRGLINLFRNKNKKERTEYLMPRTKKALQDWKDHLEWMRNRKRIEVINPNTVFCRLNGTPLKRFDSAWRRICKIANIDDFHYHDLRHTFCSNLLLSGSDLKDVKEMIGHSDIAMTDRYSHITNLHKYYRQNKLAEHYANGNNQVGYT